MEFLVLLVIVAAVFGVCRLIDLGFQKVFRSQPQHMSGHAVRLNKRYGTFGLLLSVVGVGAILTGISGEKVLLWGGVLVLLVGIGLIVYYMSFGIFYDDDTFLATSLRKKSTTYRFDQIVHQQLYVITGGNMLVELHMDDGKAVQLYTQMDGSKDFLNHAFFAWCRQKGLTSQDCPFYDPAEYRWFPGEEEA